MYKKILVPLDGSDVAEMALPYAEEISARMNARMVLISVSGPKGDKRDHLFRYYLEGVSQRVEKELEAWGVTGEKGLDVDVFLGKPADEIIRYAEEGHADLIVMASRGRSGHGPWLLGNIAAKVLRATKKTVLLIRVPPRDSSLHEKYLIRKILVPLDGSSLGEMAVPQAELIAETLGAEIILLMVLEPLRPLAGEGPTAARKLHLRLKEENDRRKDMAHKYLEKVSQPLRERGRKVSFEVVSGAAAEQIIDFAKEKAMDMIAMSSHGRSGIGRWVFGSVTDKVVHAGETPLMVVRAAKSPS